MNQIIMFFHLLKQYISDSEVYPKGVEKRKKAAYPKSVNFKLSKRGRRSHP
jgi:hypothetical protein